MCATAAALARIRFGLAPFRSPLLRGSLRFLFLRLLRCFTSPGSPRFARVRVDPYGLPHSDVRGSLPACGSPRRFAACCVFRRLQVPRHPSDTFLTLARFCSVMFGFHAVCAPLGTPSVVRFLCGAAPWGNEMKDALLGSLFAFCDVRQEYSLERR